MNKKIDPKSSSNKRIVSFFVLTLLFFTLIVAMSGCIDGDGQTAGTEDSIGQTEDTDTDEADEDPAEQTFMSPQDQDLEEQEPLEQEEDTFTVRVSPGSGSRSSSGSGANPATPVTSGGTLELDPSYANNNTDADITVIYRVGENITDGMVSIGIAAQLTVNETLDNLSIANGPWTTVLGNSNASYDANNIITITDLNIKENETIKLTLATQSIDLAGSYDFTAAAKNSGKDISNPVTATLTIYNDDSKLKALTISPGLLDPAFATGTGNYAASVDYDVEQLIIQAILSDTNAGLMVNGIITSSGDITPVILNGPGEYTEIAIDVLAEDNVSFSNYTINVSRAITPHIQDTGVSITEGSVIFGYSFYNETGALLTYADATASPYLLNSTASTVTLINQTGAASNAIPLDSMGIDASGNVTFHNLAEIAAAFNIADIMQWDHPTTVILDLRGGQGQYTWTLQETITLTPADIAAFTSIIPGSITGQVTGTTAVPLENALVQLEGMPQYSANTDAFGIYTIENVPAGSYNVTAGIADHKSSTHEQVVVLAAQPTTGIDFALTSTNPALAALHVNPGSLDPAFDTQTGTYNVAVSHTVDTIQLTAIPANPQANISINSDPYTSGDIKTIALQAPASSTDILIHVTAEDQTGTRTYNVTVNRAAVPEYTVTFNVTDGTDPVADAQILIDSQTLTTDASGIASMDLINGSYEYNITAHGYYAEQGTAVVSGEPLEIPVSMNTVPVIQDASVSITEGSVIFGYTFYNETAALLTYADATTSPYLLNSTASTVILVNGTGASSDAISLGSLDIDASGNAEYNNLSEFAAAFNIADIMHWKHPATVILDLSGGQGQYTWTLQETITLTPADIDAFTSIIPGSITGQVTSTAGIPLENALVQLEGMPQYSANTDAFGIYTIENVPAGSYNVTAGIAGHRTDTDQNVVVLAAQPTTGIDFELVPIYTVTFTVNDGKLPIGNAQIKIGGQILSTSGAGIAAIDLADGIYNYNITASGYYPVEEDVTVSGAPVDITVSMDTVPAIKNTDVSITEGSVIFGYAFYNQTGALLSYADATADPYLLNSTASTVTLLNQSGAPTAAISLDSLGPDASGNTTYENLTEFADAFSIADVTQWSHPASVTLDLSGGQGQYTWTLQKTITLTPADIAAFMSMVSTSPEGDLLDAAAGSDFIGVLFTRDGDLYYKQLGSDETWSSETLVNGSASEGKIVVDNEDKPHVAYTTDSGNIAYRTMDSGVWTDTLYIGSNHAGECYWPDIDVDSSNAPHIIYIDTMGDTAGTRNQPDLMYASLNNGDFNKVLLASGNYDSYWKGGSYPGEKPPQIAMDDNDNRYYLYQWRSYSHDMNVFHDRGIDVVGANTQSLGDVGSNTNRFDIHDLKIVDGKLYALYRNGAQIKASEMTIDAAGQMTSSVDKVVFDAGSAYSLDVASSDIVIGSKDGNNLRAHYNNIPQTFTEIDVKGEAVAIVHLGGSFYAAYTDNEDGIIKVQEVQ
ncbi:carboxypeptidase regulatory-like domain-containing protein [Methanolobus sp. WCC5]|uniref:carboxypeptidase regulatory-like domain-containing protein n=1 Tax=Methanolobus sp. WCC5 TaxID=3125785 RepID=UPI00325521BB